MFVILNELLCFCISFVDCKWGIGIVEEFVFDCGDVDIDEIVCCNYLVVWNVMCYFFVNGNVGCVGKLVVDFWCWLCVFVFDEFVVDGVKFVCCYVGFYGFGYDFYCVFVDVFDVF